MSRKPRKPENLRRRKPIKSPRKTILIVCEGEKTEPLYFKAFRRELRLSTIEVVVDGKGSGSAPISVVDYAIDLRQKRKEEARDSFVLAEFDVIWCVIDVEAPTPHKSLNDAYQKARANKLNVALSNPCFEYWYLLHFKRTSMSMQYNKDVVKALKKHSPLKKYQKGDPGTFAQVYPYTETAIYNSKTVIKEKHYGRDLRKCNPSTDVHKIVEYLQKMSQ